jgi:predicted O-methyltransferase YrrM
VLYQHIREKRPEDVLELGTARGGSAVFIAAALEANGAGRLTSVDSTRWQWLDPTPGEVLEKAGLSRRVTLDKRFSTYTWFLKAEIEKRLDAAGSVRPEYDFIFLDGSKNWSADGLAVVLAERLLRPGGWLLLDDLGWNYEKHCKTPRHYEIEIARLSDEERTQPHLRAVFDLLVRTNPAFDQFVIQDHWWGWARKSPRMSRRTTGGVLSGRNEARGARARLRQVRRRG